MEHTRVYVLGASVSNPIRESQNRATVTEQEQHSSFKPYKGKSKCMLISCQCSSKIAVSNPIRESQNLLISRKKLTKLRFKPYKGKSKCYLIA